MEKITIRRVDGNAHSEELYSFQDKFFERDQRMAVEVGGDWWLAYDGDEPVAFAGLCPSYRTKDWGYLCRVGVSETHRGFGLQRRLIRVRLARAKKHGWEGVFSDTRENGVSANNLLRCGFEIYDPKKPYGFPETIYFRKRLK